MFLTPDLSSSESEEELSSPSYASFLHFDQKPVYSDVVKKQMVSAMYIASGLAQAYSLSSNNELNPLNISF